jgi:predicted nucleic acid-binding protein
MTLPLSDIAIAALSLEHNLSIFTLDGHFTKIPGVKLHKKT